MDQISFSEAEYNAQEAKNTPLLSQSRQWLSPIGHDTIGLNHGLFYFDDEPNQSENLKSLLYSISTGVFSLD